MGVAFTDNKGEQLRICQHYGNSRRLKSRPVQTNLSHAIVGVESDEPKNSVLTQLPTFNLQMLRRIMRDAIAV
jgi:hypothetical protein